MRVGRRDVRVTNVDKVFFPGPGLTKGDLIAYYVDVAGCVGDVVFNSYTFTITQGTQTLFTCTGSFSGGSSNNQSSTPSCA